MATDTLTGPTIMGTATRTRIFKNFIEGECLRPPRSGFVQTSRNGADQRIHRCTTTDLNLIALIEGFDSFLPKNPRLRSPATS